MSLKNKSISKCRIWIRKGVHVIVFHHTYANIGQTPNRKQNVMLMSMDGWKVSISIGNLECKRDPCFR